MSGPERVGSKPYRCGLCDDVPRWRVERVGDATVTWGCPAHLAHVLADFLPIDRHWDQAVVIDLDNEWQPRGSS